MLSTMERLMEKIQGGTSGCRNVRSLKLSEQHSLCKMVYSMEDCVFIVKIFF